MLKIQVSSPTSPDVNPHHVPTLADLSRNASVISSSSSSSSTSDLTIQTPVRPRPQRKFSSPHRTIRSRSPRSPSTPRGSRPPAYIARDLGIDEDSDDNDTVQLRPPPSPQHSRSRNSSTNRGVSAADYEFGRVLGEGSYSEVCHKTTGKEFAIKVIDKGHLIRKNKIGVAYAEKDTLLRLGGGHPGIVRLHYALQDQWSLYFVLDLLRNGDLQSWISRLGSLSLPCVKFYTAQIVDALDYMHSKGVIHRDLKPENLLFDDQFRIKITDFGTAKILDGDRATTFVGTSEYMSPELLISGETSKSSDLWALGCTIYRMISGQFVFHGLSDYLTLEQVKASQYTFPDGFDEVAKDLVQKLVVRDPSQRLGAGKPGTDNDMKALRSHPFFASVNWGTLWTDQPPPLEAGLVKREKSTDGPGFQDWEDVGAKWDAMVDGMEDSDEISWASDAEGGAYRFGSAPVLPQTMPSNMGAAEVGPLGETRPYASLPVPGKPDHDEQGGELQSLVPNGDIVPTPDTGKVETETEAEEKRDTVPPTLDDVPATVRTQPIDVPARPLRDSYSTGSATSSSDGSVAGKLSAVMEAAGLDRGRSRAQTPIGHAAEEEWLVIPALVILHDLVFRAKLLKPGESVVFSANVEASSLRRRASRLFAMAMTPKRKSRQLVLTDRRLLCLKHKPGRPYIILYEFLFSPPGKEKEKEKEKDCRYVATGVEAKGEREFVVMTVSYLSLLSRFSH
ncbi:kinase-like protein [Panus rudis PR-1116 ss-1]|nr:kinase-like protein [Panus rudis PR-1116 ss-1]